MHTSKISHHVLQEYEEMIRDTTYNLEIHLQRIDEKMTQLFVENTGSSGVSINLKDEREVTKQCLRICEDARSYIERLSNQESSLWPGTLQDTMIENSFEAQSRTRQVLDENRDRFAETVDHLRNRLDLLLQDDHYEKDNQRERSQLQADIDISKRCLDVCKMASEVSHQKVHRIGEVVAEGDSDQVVVTTLADLFDVKTALCKDNSAQLVGSMTSEDLRHLTEKRYSSRSGLSADPPSFGKANDTRSSAVFESTKNKRTIPPQIEIHEQSSTSRTRQTKPSPNEIRKRHTDGAME